MGSQMDCLSVPMEDCELEKGGKKLASSGSMSSLGSEKSRAFYQSLHGGHGAGATHHHRQRIKILFLDVDGVLNGENYGYGGVDDSLLYLLKTILDETHCKIVLSTTWRLNQCARATLLHFMKARADINVEDIIIGDTPSLKGKKRAYEIECFLQSEEFQSQYMCTTWCALDDLPLFQQYPTFMDHHFVRTNYRTGVTSRDAFKVVQILNEDDEYSNSYDY
eukprot:CAMPEP_0197073732 /NCGR_PEP_ID=MMETSP1384-20130603/210754_1 /TAXON_ID=29189 /ORGANISM="Ammonia sp." /LENGTH=220 /DNA_ID=CAMNT_0042512571 /DNA_START=256 /DNA_END=918 /DNA_ORIENTATION=+